MVVNRDKHLSVEWFALMYTAHYFEDSPVFDRELIFLSTFHTKVLSLLCYI